MNQFHIREKNVANAKIKSLNISIDRNNNAISRLLSQSKISEFDKNQIKIREDANVNHLKDIESTHDRLDKLSKGLLDEEFKNENLILQEKINKESEKLVQKNKDKKDRKVVEKKLADKGFSLNRADTNVKYLENDYKKFCRLSNRIPSYISRNLKEMPSNKGYIISDRNDNDIWCFGELEAEKNKPTIMFKKLKDDILHIYEIDSKCISIFEKRGRDQKILKSRELRVILV